MPTIRYTIEPSWTTQAGRGEIEIPDEELEGLSPDEREKAIAESVAEAVNNDCPWGWEEVEQP